MQIGLRKILDSIPDGVFEVSRCLYHSGRPMALGWIQPLAEMSTWGIKAAGAYG